MYEELTGNEKFTEIFKHLVDCNPETICAASHHGLTIYQVSA